MEEARSSDDTQAGAQPAAEGAAAAPTKIKAMRRQPCPCGSGKVFKNCHEGDPGYEVATDAAAAVSAPVVKDAKAGKGPALPAFQSQAPKFSSAAKNTGTVHRRKV